MPLERRLSARRSQRRKDKADKSVGLTSVISSRKAAKDLVNSLAPPQNYDEGGEDNGDDNRPPRSTPKKSTTAPKSPQPRRKSIVNANLPHAPGQLPGQKIGKKRSSLAPVHKQNAKMDVARAMGIMGFNSSRWLECSQTAGTDPKAELDKAQFARMQELLKRKKTVMKDAEQGLTKGGDDLTGYKKRTADRGVEKIQDDLLNLQEAYQFLMKKYRLNERKMQIKTVGYASILGGQVSSGSQSDWDNAVDDKIPGLGSTSGNGTRLSEDLGDLNVTTEVVKQQDKLIDDIFA